MQWQVRALLCHSTQRAELRSHCKKQCMQHSFGSLQFPCLLSPTLCFSTSWKVMKEISFPLSKVLGIPSHTKSSSVHINIHTPRKTQSFPRWEPRSPHWISFTVLHTTFLFMLLCLQVPARGSKEERGKDCGVAWATDYTLKGGEDKCEESTYDKQETWNKVSQSPVRYGCWFWSWSTSHIIFHCFHLPCSFGLFLLPTVLQVLWNLFHCTHTWYLHIFWHLPLFLLAALFAALLPCVLPHVHPNFTLLLPMSHLEVIWHIYGQVRAWQCFEVWVYHAQNGSTRDKRQETAPGCS